MLNEEIKDMEKLSVVLQECQIDKTEPPGIVLSETTDATLLVEFPKPKNRIPPVFLHKPLKFSSHMRKVLNLGIQFYRPIVGHHYTKLCCHTFQDHKALVQYFENKQLPYHTFGLPQKRKMKVVFRGLPTDVDLNCLKKELKSVSIPIIRLHIMQNKKRAKDLPILVLGVVPNNDEGRKILLVQKLFGHNIKLEPLKQKIMQCHRCQKWGHSQRYCHGHVKCVKCGGDHLTKKCSRDPVKQPPKCANCNNDHTANFKLCPYSPMSPEYVHKMTSANDTKAMFPSILPKKLVTIQNCHLYMRGRI